MNEQDIKLVAARMLYPPTPAIRLPQRQILSMPRPAAAVLLVTLIVASLMLIQPVRAQIVQLLQVGGVTIQVGEVDTSQATPVMVLAGKTTLAEAQLAVRYQLAYPLSLGRPNAVYRQQEMVVMQWSDVALYQFPYPGMFKGTPVVEWVEIEGTAVAAWIDTPHLLWFEYSNGLQQQRAYLVQGNVLIWEDNGHTYRLESDRSQQDMIALAEELITQLEEERK